MILMLYSFGRYILDVNARELALDGTAVPLQPLVFDLLVHLVQNADRVVPKDELMDTLWPDVTVTEASLQRLVSLARRALTPGGCEGAIRSFVRRGYRFTAETHVQEAIAGASHRASASVPMAAESGQDNAHRLSAAGRARSAGGPEHQHPHLRVVEGGASPHPVSEHQRAPLSTGPVHLEQEIRFCHSADGTRIAYALAGAGPLLVKSFNWLHHLEYDWESPIWRHFFLEMTRHHRLLRYDGRGMGLSAWNVTDFGFEAQVDDLSAVIKAAAVGHFPMLGLSQGCPRSIAYAVRNPGRVTKLVLLGGYARGWKRRDDVDMKVMRSAALDMIRAAWGKDNPAVRQVFTSLYMPDAPAECQRWFSDVQRKSTTAENAAAAFEASGDVDIRDLLGQVKVPTLVIHARHDAGVPFEQGQELAAGIPGARFAVLDTTNHILPATDPAWHRCARLIQEFLED